MTTELRGLYMLLQANQITSTDYIHTVLNLFNPQQ